jgi:hypothetical protein
MKDNFSRMLLLNFSLTYKGHIPQLGQPRHTIMHVVQTLPGKLGEERAESKNQLLAVKWNPNSFDVVVAVSAYFCMS